MNKKITRLILLTLLFKSFSQECSEYCLKCQNDICEECNEEKGFKLSKEKKCISLRKQPFMVVVLAILIPLGILMCGLIFCCMKKTTNSKISERRTEAIQRRAGVGLRVESYKQTNTDVADDTDIVQPQPLPYED